tara:strand:+ start:986 stop:1222 length:237 start_codon:yes stop_codon:yes gene_type:complete
MKLSDYLESLPARKANPEIWAFRDRLNRARDAFEGFDCREDYDGIANEWCGVLDAIFRSFDRAIAEALVDDFIEANEE